VQLVKVDDGYQLWSERYDREMEDVFAIQDEIATAIADQLKVTLSSVAGEPLVKPRTKNLEAYQLYLKGRHFWNQRGAGMSKAIQHFNESKEKDPEFAPPYAGIADTYCLLGMYGYLPARVTNARARPAAERCVALDDRLAEGHYSLGLWEEYFGWDLHRAEAEFRRSIECDPRYAAPRAWLAHLLGFIGRGNEVPAHAERALALEPLSAITHIGVGWGYCMAGLYDQALRAFSGALELAPRFAPCHWSLGWIRVCQSSLDEGVAALERAVALDPGSRLMLSFVGVALAKRGDSARARDVLARLAQMEESESYHLHSAWVYMALGELDRGFELFEAAFDVHDMMAWSIGRFPGFEWLLAEPRWVTLLESVGLEWLAAK
jgi:tetratricopeptide (TPR) repeat protein